VQAKVPTVSRPTVLGLDEGQLEWGILAVEDIEENRLLLSSLLRQTGFEMREAINGQEAVILFEQWRAHYIWMDIRMPAMDGDEATSQIRQLPGGDHVKIVARTVSAFKEQHEKMVKAGCVDVVHKPFQIHQLFDVMVRLMGVDYIYIDEEKEEEVAVAAKPPVTLTRKQLLKLPPKPRKELHEAAILLDDRCVIEVLDQIETIDFGIASALRRLTENAALVQILRLLEEGDLYE
jgi:Amt family ammonium transporter